MYIKPQYAKIALKYADEKRKAQGIVFDPRAIASYRAKLKKLANDNVIAEGSALDYEIYNYISDDIKSLIDSAVRSVKDKSEDFRKKVKPSDYVLAAHDYLLAMANIELGSPNIPVDELRDNFRTWTAGVMEAKPNFGISTLQAYNNQRRVDAIDLITNKISPLMQQLHDKETKPEALGKLIAEYQALARRQAGHGAFWRLFHPTENTARTTLLNDMQSVIKSHVSGLIGVDISKDDPDEVARAVAESLHSSRLNSATMLYDINPAAIFGYKDYIINKTSSIMSNAVIDIEEIISENEKDFAIANGQVESGNIAIENGQVGDNGEINGNVDDDVDEYEVAKDEENQDEEIEEPDNNAAEELVPVAQESVNYNVQAGGESSFEKFTRLSNNKTFKAQLGNSIWEKIGNKVGRDVRKNDVIDGILETMLSAASNANEMYDNLIQDNASADVLFEFVHDNILTVYSEAFNSLESCEMNVQDRAVAAQKLSDVIIDEILFVGFMKPQYETYASNYAISDPEMVGEILEMFDPDLSAGSIRAIIGNARRELGARVREESKIEAPKVVVKEQPKAEIKAEPKAEIKAVNEVKVEEQPIVEEQPKAEIKAEPKAEIEEEKNKPAEVIKEEPQPAVPSASDKFKDIDNDNFRRALGDELWDVLKGNVRYTVNNSYVIPRVVSSMLRVASNLNAKYDEGKKQNLPAERINELMHENVAKLFTETFNSLNGCNMHTTAQVVVAQKMCDIVLGKVTVVGFNGAEFAGFSKGYALANGTVVTDLLTQTRRGLSKEGIDEVVSEARAELGIEAIDNSKVEEPIVSEPIVSEPEKNEENEIKVEAQPEEEQPEEEPNYVEIVKDLLWESLEKIQAARKAEEDRIKAQEEKLRRFAEIANRINRLTLGSALSKIEDEATRKAEEQEAQRKAEEEAKRRAEEQEARIKAEEEEKRRAEEAKLEDKTVTPAEFALIFDKADKRAGDAQLTESIKGEIRSILANSGVDKSKIEDTVKAVYEKCLFDIDDGIAAHYRFTNKDMSDSNSSRSISSIMDGMIKGAGNNLRPILNAVLSDPADRMVAHQKLLDVMLKSYSPVAIGDGFDKKYINNYFLDNSENLEAYYRSYINRGASAIDVDAFIKSVADARQRIENSNIVVEAPKVEEQPKAEPVAPTVTDPEPKPEPTIPESAEVKDIEESKSDDAEITVGENITPAEFAYIFNRADKSAGNSQLTESVKGQMREILANSGIDKSNVNEIVDKVFNKSLFDSDDGLAAYYRHINADMSASAKARSSSSIMEMMIKGAGNNIHLALNGSFSNAAEQMIVHQKLLDIVLNNYSPLAFSKGIDEKYLNNYYLDDSKNLESYYRSYINKNASARDIEGFAKSISDIHVKDEGVDNSKAEEARRKAEEERSLEEKKLKELAVEKAELDKERITLEEALKNSEAELTTLNEEIAKLDNQLVLEQERVRIEAEEAKRKAEEEETRRKASEDPSAKETRKLKIQQNVAESIASDNTPHVNLRMHKQCLDAVNNNELAQSVRQQLKNIKDDQGLINDVCRLPREKILNIYRNATANNTNMHSRLAATEMARELFIDIYRLTVKHDYTKMAMRVFMAQEMTDVLMRNYSPVAFVPKVFDDAADYYIVGHKSILNNTMLKAHPNVYKHYTDEDKEKIYDYGRSGKGGTGQIEAYINRRDNYKKEIQEYIGQNKAMGANVLDADYIREDVISAYRVQYLDACGATKAIKANVNDVKTVLVKAGLNESDKNAQKFVDGIMFEMPSIYDNASHFARLNGTFGDMMAYMSKEVFYRAYGNIQDYNGINEITRLALAQQLADVILKAYSPAKFNDACKPEYTNGFAISNAANIKVALDKNNIKLTDEEISQLKEDVAYANEHLGETLGEGKVDIIAEYKHAKEQKRLDEEARIKAEEEAKIKAEEEEARRKAEEEEARRKAEEEEARRKAEEEEARRKAEEEAKVKENKAEPDAFARYKRESKKIPLDLGENIDVDSISAIYKEFQLSRSDDNLTASVKAQLAEILLKNGVERSKVGSMVKNGFRTIINEMDDLYNKHVERGIYRDTPEVVTRYFFEWLATSFYDRFASFESVEENIVLIQKISDVFFKNYSPVAFTDGILDKYADNYQINHPRELIEGFAILHTKYGGKITPELKVAIEEAKNKLNSIELKNKDIKVEDFEKEIPIVEVALEKKPNVDKVALKVEPKVAPKEEPKVEEKPKYERKVVEKYERKVERRELGTDNRSQLTNDDLNFLYNECKKSMGDPKLTEYVKSQIGEILFVSGVDESKISTTVDKIADKCLTSLGMLSFYNKNNLARFIGGMTAENASSFIANNTVGFLQSLTAGVYSSPEEELVVNQRILDVLLKNYSPIAFLKNDLSKYSNNHIVNDENMVVGYSLKYLRQQEPDKVKAFVAGVKSARKNIESKFKADASKIEAKDDKAPVRERIVIDMSAVDAPNVNAPKVEAPKVDVTKEKASDNFRESIVVNELSEKITVKEVSEKVKDLYPLTNTKQKD